ncbi:hypothetical protein V6N12_036870 [Hibiscus sabdariffa]|uniref:Uncharacterized protein n=1 Tax=Hibiscus sabdariffa TaxID=183260 RepID=A0ABR2BV47_9ROSI
MQSNHGRADFQQNLFGFEAELGEPPLVTVTFHGFDQILKWHEFLFHLGARIGPLSSHSYGLGSNRKFYSCEPHILYLCLRDEGGKVFSVYCDEDGHFTEDEGSNKG